MEQLSPFIRQAEAAVTGVLKQVKQPVVEGYAKKALAAVDPWLERCSCPTSHVNEWAFYVLFGATLVFLTLAQRYSCKANKALIGFSWASAVSALNFFWLMQGSPLGDFAVIQSVASVPFVVYALSSLGGAGFVSFVLVLVLLVAKDYFLAMASLQHTFDTKMLFFVYSVAAGGFASLFVWLWGLRGGLRGVLVTLAFTVSVLLQRAAWVLGKHGLKLLSSHKEAVLFATTEIVADVAVLVLVALVYPSAGTCTPAPAAINRGPAPTTAAAAKKKKQ